MNLRTTKCKCGYEITNKDIIPPLMNMEEAKGYYDPNFYGGNISKFAKAKCKCGKVYLTYLKTENNGYIVKDMEPIQNDFEEMTIAELRDFAKENNIQIPRDKTKKEEIIEHIKSEM